MIASRNFSFLLVFLLTATIAFTQCNLQNAVNLGPDTSLCPGQSITLTATSNTPNTSYLWNNGSTGSTRLVTSPGTYSVIVSNVGTNLIVNGNFESGNTGFSTNYTLGTGGSWGTLSSPGTYAISSSPSLVHNNFSSCNDHTIGTGTQMMVINGAGTPNTNVWCQTVTTQSNTDYQLGTWISNALNEFNVANLQFSINGTTIGALFSTTPYPCDWQQFYQVWNSGTSTSANICIVNQNTSDGGNDFMLDDITFAPVCVSKDTVVVSYFPAFSLNLGLDQQKCEGDTVLLDAGNPTLTFNWNDNSSTQTKTVTQTGMYNVTVSNNGRCPKSDTVLVTFHQTVNAGPDSSITLCNSFSSFDLNQLINNNTSVLSKWVNETTQTQLVSTLLNPAILDPSTTFNYIALSTYCPSDTAKISVFIKKQQTAGNNYSNTLCNTSGQFIDLTTHLSGNTTVGNWSETTSSNQFNAANGQLDVSLLTAGNYYFQYVVDSELPCIADTANFTITIVENPIIQFTSDKNSGCTPLIIDFTNSSSTAQNSTYSWDFNNGSTSNLENPSGILFSTPNCNDITLSITAEGLCTTSKTLQSLFCVHPNPIADFEYSPGKIFSDDPTVKFDNTSINNTSNQWSFGDGFNSSAIQPTHTFPDGEGQSYLVELIVTSQYGCKDTTSKIILIEDQIVFFVPNAFTPNGDEINQYFNPIMTAGIDVTTYVMEIYNRWGEKVFETHDTSIGWDGTYNGSIVQGGSYTWKIAFTSSHQVDRFIKTGHVTLIR